jgi:Sigma-70, region 4
MRCKRPSSPLACAGARSLRWSGPRRGFGRWPPESCSTVIVERLVGADLYRALPLSTTTHPPMVRIAAMSICWMPYAGFPRGNEPWSLHYLADWSVSDVAELLAIAPGTVKSTLSDARVTLRALLTPGVADV